MAADEYRVEVDLDDEAHGHPFSERLAALDLDDEVAAKLGDRVIVTRDGSKMFVYVQSREAVEEAERVVNETLLEDGLFAEVRSTRWDPGEKRVGGCRRAWRRAGRSRPRPSRRPMTASSRSTRCSRTSSRTSPSSCATSGSSPPGTPSS